MNLMPSMSSSRVVFPASRPRGTWASAGHSSRVSARHRSASDDAWSTTGLTSTAGSMTISPEGGP